MLNLLYFHVYIVKTVYFLNKHLLEWYALWYTNFLLTVRMFESKKIKEIFTLTIKLDLVCF